MKLQDAYVAEKGDKIGSWQNIGYKMLESNNFKYLEEGTAVGDLGYIADKVDADMTTGKANGWAAANKAALNDCAVPTSGGNWTLGVSANTGVGGVVVYTVTMGTGCEALTPSFKGLHTAK